MDLHIHHYSYFTDEIHRKVLSKWCQTYKRTNHFCVGPEGYNLASVSLNDEMELYCVTVYVNMERDNPRDPVVEPGSSSRLCTNLETHGVTPGKNFFWNDWEDLSFIELSVLFVGSYDGKRLNVDEKFPPYIYDVPEPINFRQKENRLVNLNGNIYIHDTCFSSLVHVNVDWAKQRIELELKPLQKSPLSVYYNKYIEAHEKERTYWKIDKNMTLLEYDGSAQTLLLLRWFKGNVLEGLVLGPKEYGYKDLITMQGDVLPTTQHDKWLPPFSFGTPLLTMGNYKIGVGHVKIRTPTNHYHPSSKVYQFERMVSQQFPQLFGTRYRHYLGRIKEECFGYIYGAYFYCIFKANGRYHMKFSDVWLPVDLRTETAHQYKFSLLFAQGIFKKIIVGKELICVSGGEGDWYNTIMTFDPSNVLHACRHDLENFLAQDIDFQLLLRKRGKTYASRELTSPKYEHFSKLPKLTPKRVLIVLAVIALLVFGFYLAAKKIVA